MGRALSRALSPRHELGVSLLNVRTVHRREVRDNSRPRRAKCRDPIHAGRVKELIDARPRRGLQDLGDGVGDGSNGKDFRDHG